MYLIQIFECMDIVSYLSKRFYKEVIVFEEILLTSSPLLLSATAYARYRLVSKPYKKQISILWSLSTACLIFLYSISVAVLSSVETFYYRAIYDIASVVIRCLIPFVIITVCHIQIVRLLTQQNERIKIYKVLSSVRYAQGLRRKQRLKRLLLAILVIFLTTSCPLETVKLLVLTQCVEVDDNIRKGIELAAINGTLLTPLIYAYWNDSLKREVFKIMTSFVCKQYRKFSVSSVIACIIYFIALYSKQYLNITYFNAAMLRAIALSASAALILRVYDIRLRQQ
ncbi:hypothetical protein QR680_015931 [Steinernema hermaphroditum]|uniref:G-protein coupled receptors family 1 profile domain-containing protein n=1 Tax=Steinernema hermaphroditum TaxID=289476 RepID=A0AA39H9F7_9BILA|nr:hypothetical protein QR680_015931 [Steinernema hermaphroditum]